MLTARTALLIVQSFLLVALACTSELEIAVSTTPSSAVVLAGNSLQLQAEVTGTPDNRVIWSLVDANEKDTKSKEERFVETFLWQGPHAAVIQKGAGTTVWWNPDHWDARGGTAHNAVASKGAGHHIDIHPSVPDNSDGSAPNVFVLGGDGRPGVGIMHTDFESIVSARLRNPLLITPEQPGVVEFRATKFNTTGHWWEVALSPANQVIGAEFTAIPDASKEQTFAGNQGPGHTPPEDSLNFIIIGRNDVPCTTGWEVRTGLARALDGKREEYVGPIYPTSPEEKDKLYGWRLEFYPERVELFADLNEDGTLEHLFNFKVQIPWQEVYVHLIALAYEADHHPQDGTCRAWQGQVREFPWKDVYIGPVKYARTTIYPREQGIEKTPQATGWTDYDLRDTQRHGLAAGLLQPNAMPYSKHSSMAFCSDKFVYGCDEPVSSKTLTFDLPDTAATTVVHAQLVYDIRGGGTAALAVNEANIGLLPGARTVKGASGEQWVRGSLEMDPRLFQAGENSISVFLTGNVQMDRLQIEFGYDLGPENILSIGRLDRNGLFTAPTNVEQPLTVTVHATSVASPEMSAVVAITVVP